MKNNQIFFVGFTSVLLLIITFQIAVFAKYSHSKEAFCHGADAATNHSVQWFELILFFPIQALSGAT